MRVLVVQPDPDTPLGRIAAGLDRAGVSVDVRAPSGATAPLAVAAERLREQVAAETWPEHRQSLRQRVVDAGTDAVERPRGNERVTVSMEDREALRGGVRLPETMCASRPTEPWEWVPALAAGIRGELSAVLPQTARFFRTHGIAPDALEPDLASADEVMAHVADAIADGFAAALVGEPA